MGRGGSVSKGCSCRDVPETQTAAPGCKPRRTPLADQLADQQQATTSAHLGAPVGQALQAQPIIDLRGAGVINCVDGVGLGEVAAPPRIRVGGRVVQQPRRLLLSRAGGAGVQGALVRRVVQSTLELEPSSDQTRLPPAAAQCQVQAGSSQCKQTAP